jgi:hypothetical protein
MKCINKYYYQPIVRETEIDEEVANDTYSPPYIKLKIDLDFVTSKPDIKLYNKTSLGYDRTITSSYNYT